MATTLTWLGHSAFRINTPGGKRIYVDPFLNGNPKCPDSEKEPERVDAICITHGHNDHVGDTFELAKTFQCPVVAPVELRDLIGMMGYVTDAPAGSARPWEIIYTGEPCGLVFDLGEGPKLYFAGDTNVFGDMALIA